MAKKKESIFKDWSEIDSQLKKIGELEIRKSKLEGELTIKVNELKAKYTTECAEISDDIKNIKAEITRFCEQNKDAFLAKRSKKLNFGTLAYRVSESVSFILKEANIIKALTVLNLDFCLNVKTTIDKESLKTLDDGTLTKIGVAIVKKDKLSIEPNMVEIAASEFSVGQRTPKAD